MPRTKGAADIPKRQKARILAKKNMGEYGNTAIARQEGVSLSTVEKINEQNLPPDVLAMSERYLQQILAYCEANAMRAQEQVFRTIHKLPADKAAKVAESNFNMSRTIRGEATINQPVRMSPDEEARLLFRMHIEEYNFTRDQAIEGVGIALPEADIKLLTDGSDKI